MYAHDATKPTAAGRALVVGLGTAGLTAAIRLHQTGWQVTALERAPGLRGGGHFVSLHGAAVSVARRMGVWHALGTRPDAGGTQHLVDRQGRRVSAARRVACGTRTVIRGEVERALFDALPSGVDTRFCTSPTGITPTRHGALVSMYDSTTGEDRTEHFDLVVGADGVCSTVRELAFGPHGDHLHGLDRVVAACLLSQPVAGLRAREGLTLAEPGRAAWVFPVVGHPPSIVMTYRVDQVDAEFQCPSGESLRRAFGPEPLGPVLEELIEQFEHADTRVFGSAQQVRMSSWRAGRVVLLGDAAWALTLYAGMGTSSAMAGADLLATVLQQHPGDIPVAFGEWEHRMRRFIDYHQGAVDGGPELFVPQDRRRQLANAMALRLRNVPALGIVRRKACARSLGLS